MRLTALTRILILQSKEKKLIICRSGRNEPTQECMLRCVYGAFVVVGCVYGTFLQRDRNRPLILFPFSRILVLKHILTHFDHRKPPRGVFYLAGSLTKNPEEETPLEAQTRAGG